MEQESKDARGGLLENDRNDLMTSENVPKAYVRLETSRDGRGREEGKKGETEKNCRKFNVHVTSTAPMPPWGRCRHHMAPPLVMASFGKLCWGFLCLPSTQACHINVFVSYRKL